MGRRGGGSVKRRKRGRRNGGVFRMTRTLCAIGRKRGYVATQEILLLPLCRLTKSTAKMSFASMSTPNGVSDLTSANESAPMRERSGHEWPRCRNDLLQLLTKSSLHFCVSTCRSFVRRFPRFNKISAFHEAAPSSSIHLAHAPQFPLR